MKGEITYVVAVPVHGLPYWTYILGRFDSDTQALDAYRRGCYAVAVAAFEKQSDALLFLAFLLQQLGE